MTTHKPKTRKERRVERRKAHILDAAARVFAEKGFHRTTTKDIAEAADIAEGTIYNYFSSKDDLLLTMINQLADLGQRSEVFELGLSEDPRGFLTRFIEERFRLSQERAMLWLAVLPEILSTPGLRERYTQTVYGPALRILETHFQARIDAGELPSFDVELTVRLLSGMLLGLQVMLILGDETVEQAFETPNTLAASIIALVFDPLGGESPSKTAF